MQILQHSYSAVLGFYIRTFTLLCDVLSTFADVMRHYIHASKLNAHFAAEKQAAVQCSVPYFFVKRCRICLIKD